MGRGTPTLAGRRGLPPSPPGYLGTDAAEAVMIEDKICWFQLALWMMLPLEQLSRAWHLPVPTRIGHFAAFAVIVAAGVLLSAYCLYVFP
jgi:hypothetical protein